MGKIDYERALHILRADLYEQIELFGNTIQRDIYANVLEKLDKAEKEASVNNYLLREIKESYDATFKCTACRIGDSIVSNILISKKSGRLFIHEELDKIIRIMNDLETPALAPIESHNATLYLRELEKNARGIKNYVRQKQISTDVKNNI